MRKRNPVLLLTCLNFLLIITAPAAFAASRPTALFLLDADPSVRLSSMGNLPVSMSPDDAFYNPASLGWTVNSGATFSQWPSSMDDSKYNFVGFIFPLTKYGSFNVSYLNYAMPEETIEELDGTTRTLRLEQDQLVSVGYGREITEEFFAGANVKYLSSTLASDYTASSVMGDIGVMYTALDDRQSAGIMLKNYGQPLNYYQTDEDLPQELQLGYARKMELKPHHSMVAGVAVSRVLNNDTDAYSAGAEYIPGIPYLAVRAGLKLAESELLYTIGLGITYNKIDIGLGYAGNLSSDKVKYDGTTPIRFSLSWLFGPVSDYDKGQAYSKRGMMKKAAAFLRDSQAGEAE